jgi:large subunit ribosomal protein L9
MTELAKGLGKLVLLLKVKTGDDGKMFGSVTAGTVIDELKQQFDIALDKKKVHLEKPIRALGEHEVEMRLHADVRATLKVRIESTTPPPAIPELTQSEGRAGDKGAEGDRRGRGGFRRPRVEKASEAPAPAAEKPRKEKK